MYKHCFLLQGIFWIKQVVFIILKKKCHSDIRERERERKALIKLPRLACAWSLILMFLCSFFHSQLGTGRRSSWNRRLHHFLSKTAIQRGWWRWGYFLGIHSEHFYFVDENTGTQLCRIQCQEFHWILIFFTKIHFIQHAIGVFFSSQ